MILGLDVSTNSTGYAVIDKEGKLLKYGFIDTSKEKDFFDKANIFALQMKNLSEEFCFEKIAIEEILGKFSGGRSSAKVIIALARFNALVSYKCFEYTEIKPVHINVLRARSLALGHSVPRGLSSKEYVLKKVIEWYPDIILPKMKRKDAIAKNAYDIADAVVIGKAMMRYDE